MAVVIKCFDTPGGLYVYDRETNSILRARDAQEYEAFIRVERGIATDEDWQLLTRYVQQGYLKETCLEEIIHPETLYVGHYLETRIEQLTIQITQACNLRCAYCAYGGNYKNQREHSGAVMPLETIKKCVDFIMSRSRGVEQIAIGLYGGEPLLMIDSIRECVKYVRENYEYRDVHFTITTNGTIFNDEIIQFLDEYNIDVSISLDGPKDIHDANRVFANGKGSFDVIMSNLTYINQQYPVFFKKIRFMTTVAPGVDLSCVSNFYTVDEILSDSAPRFGAVSPFSAKNTVRFDDLFRLTNEYNKMKMLLTKLGLYSKGKISKLFAGSLDDIYRFYERLSKAPIVKHSHHSGPCLPTMRPFVDVHGNIYPCERISENSKVMNIGHINTGFDINKIYDMLNVGKLTVDECKNCWAFTYCGLCVAACDGGNKLCAKTKLKNCINSKYKTYYDMKTICLMLENGYDFNAS